MRTWLWYYGNYEKLQSFSLWIAAHGNSLNQRMVYQNRIPFLSKHSTPSIQQNTGQWPFTSSGQGILEPTGIEQLEPKIRI